MPSPDEHVEPLQPPVDAADWVGLSRAPLPVDVASGWVARPECGAIVTFCGTARDHSDGRPGVQQLDYEAYDEQVVPRLADLAAEIRRRWSDVGRLALLHRVGPLAVGDVAVVVAVSMPHRQEAFDAALYGIDTLKETVPIWKKETWDGGESWGLEPQHLSEIGSQT